MRNHDSLSDQKENNAPMVEIFGGVFALLLVLFLIITVLSQATLLERLEANSDEGLYKIGWGASGSGYTVITFPSELRIVETNELVVKGEICKPDSPFVRYAQKIYQSKKQQLVFALLEGSVPTMAEARNCMLKIMPNKRLNIGWIIANNELLKSVSLDDIPAYIKRVIK
ncbi:MAG: hypothetical protein ACNYNY_04625 [Candidatus Oxydemutatoraceae bacterium WSBS_2016_MAG_OTU14]